MAVVLGVSSGLVADGFGVDGELGGPDHGAVLEVQEQLGSLVIVIRLTTVSTPRLGARRSNHILPRGISARMAACEPRTVWAHPPGRSHRRRVQRAWWMRDGGHLSAAADQREHRAMDTTQPLAGRLLPGLPEPAVRWWRRPLAVGVRHYLEMVIAMAVGMFVLGPVSELLGAAIGAGPVLARTDVAAVVMATNMTIAMTAWMRIRRHRWAPIAEMAAAMYIPFLVLLIPYWAGLVDGSTVHTGGHLLMLPAMVLVMLRRRREYTTHRHAA